MSEYPAGTVAMVTYDDKPPRVMMRVNYGDDGSAWVDKDYKILDRHNRVTDVRPLVVLDLHHPSCPDVTPATHGRMIREHIEWLVDEANYGFPTALEVIADQIEAQTRPPKPGEPTGLGAVVEDAEGDRWVRTFPDGGPAKWRVASLDLDREPWAVWSAIDAVKVLSEGVRDV